ncbi:hypothetical protein ACROYT_G008114 [Oculina patagonica]
MSKNCTSIGRTDGKYLRVLLVAIILMWSDHCGKAEIYPTIFWTPHNPVFLETSHELKVFPYTRLHIVCPNPWTILTTLKAQVAVSELYENIWRVDESSYKTCSIGSAAARPALMLCDSPKKVQYITFEFQYPALSSTTYPPGKEFFFIATSNGSRNSLNSTSGGHCSTHNMRFKVYVCRNRQDSRCSVSTENTGQTRKPAQVPKQNDKVSSSASFSERNGTAVISQSCNNTVFAPKPDAETFHKAKIFICTVAILASVAFLSIALNVILLWQKHKQEPRKRTESAS